MSPFYSAWKQQKNRDRKGNIGLEWVKDRFIYYATVKAALQINIILLPVTMNRKIKKPPVKFNFRRSQ